MEAGCSAQRQCSRENRIPCIVLFGMVRRHLLILVLLVGFSRTSARLPSFDPAAAAAGISSALRSDGLHGENVTVQSGAYSFFFLADCAKHKLPSCFALNADSPYGLTSLPKAPGEKQYRGCVTKTGRCGDGCNPNDDPHLTKSVCPDGMPMQWRLGRDEAVLLIGRTPPKAKYWSITNENITNKNRLQ